ncbi:hypothetical protein GF325_01845 [Candidatus Bathyarchaeota archaeon]|nr:hypothetical protein [Candidatus Bathyarchaeota archaeon]
MDYNPRQPNSTVPDWENIRFITSDLKDALDNYSDESEPIPIMKVRLARVIAQMRDEKGMEDRRLKDQESNPFAGIQEMTEKIRQKLLKSIGYK